MMHIMRDNWRTENTKLPIRLIQDITDNGTWINPVKHGINQTLTAAAQ
jgi:hypothetical protein